MTELFVQQILDFDDKEWIPFVEKCQPIPIDFNDASLDRRVSEYVNNARVSDKDINTITDVTQNFMIPLMRILRTTYETAKENNQLDQWINSIILPFPLINDTIKDFMENRMLENIFDGDLVEYKLITQRYTANIGIIKNLNSVMPYPIFRNLIDITFWKSWVQKLNNSNIKSAI